jgi:hypothetical protein
MMTPITATTIAGLGRPNSFLLPADFMTLLRWFWNCLKT